jgi:hypothetical protein
MLPEDAFWAARIVSKFSDDAIRGIVREGDLRNPEAETHLIEVICRRRDKILARYFRTLNPLADFRVVGQAGAPVLAFGNYGEDAGLGTAEAYEYEWSTFDNDSGQNTALGSLSRTPARSLPIPDERPAFLMVRIRTRAPGLGAWGKPIDVYLRSAPELTVVGVERES